MNLLSLEHKQKYCDQKERLSHDQNGQEKYRSLLKAMPDVVLELTANGKITDIHNLNNSYFLPEAKSIGQHVEDVFPPDIAEIALTFTEKALTSGQTQQFAFILPIEGRRRFFKARMSPVGKSKTIVLVREDLTKNGHDKKKDGDFNINMLPYHSLYDPLTGLPNTNLLMDRMGRALRRITEKMAQYHFAVLCLELDRFAIIRGSLGPAGGDYVLVETSRRLSQNLRKVDTIARFSEKSFVVILDGITSEREVCRFAEKVKADFSSPIRVNDQDLYLTLNIGIVYSTAEYQSPRQIVQDAETAVNWARSEKQNRYRFFRAQMHERALSNLNLETAFRNALKNREFLIHYQPIMDLENETIFGFEALIRWQHPQKGVILPDQFIPLAEKIGQIDALGEWVLREGCRQINKIQLPRAELQPPVLCVNISVHQLLCDRFVPNLRAILHEIGFPPDRLELEITESMMMDNAEQVLPALNKIRDLGVQLAIDDFGTGHSSLSYLHQLPVNTLKIDRSFIHKIGKQEIHKKHSRIVQTIISLALQLDMDTVAEGIETVEQFRSVKHMCCAFGQGYLFAKPLPLNQLLDWIQNTGPEITQTIATADSGNLLPEQTDHTCISQSGSPAAPPIPELPVLSEMNLILTGATALKNLISSCLTISPCTTVQEVRKQMENESLLSSAVVLENNRPVGLLMNYWLDRKLSTQYGLSLYLHREVCRIMDRSFLAVKDDVTVEEVAKLAMKRDGNRKYDDIIVTRDETFQGVLSVQNILDTLARERIETAKGANPLTGLPGNINIEKEIHRRMTCRSFSTLLYFDLDNFKVYNDAYGFENGDRLILFTAQILKESVAEMGGTDDYIGHVGGDDFIIIADSERAVHICQTVLDKFRQGIAMFYDKADRAKGHIHGTGRDGQTRKYPFVSISIGAMDCLFQMSVTMDELSHRAAAIKKYAKSIPGNSYVKDRRKPLGTTESENTL